MKPVYPEPRTECLMSVIAKDQPQYLPLPANIRRPYVETKWRLTWSERLEVLLTGNLYLTVKTFGQPLQPLRLRTRRDAILGDGQ